MWRYPVKSMLGEQLDAVEVGEGGIAGDRRWGVVDRESEVVASAKLPSRWRRLLQIRTEALDDGGVRLHFPDGRTARSGEDAVNDVVSEFLGRPVRLAAQAAPGATLERAVPDEVLDSGVDAAVGFTVLEIAAASPPGTFFDFSPLQVVTTASLAEVGRLHPAGAVDPVRYRPNVIIDTGPDQIGFVENGWVGQDLHLGPDVVARLLVPSPRCSVPTLPHGDLPGDPEALRIVARHNFVDVPIEGFGKAPCLGSHATIVHGGTLSVGDDVWLAP